MVNASDIFIKRVKSNRAMTTLFPVSAAESSVVSGQYTWALRWPLPFSCGGFRVEFFSGTVAGTLKAFWAKSTVSDDTGAGLTWTQITINGSNDIVRDGSGNELLSDFCPITIDSSTEYLFIRVVGTDVTYWDSGLGNDCEVLSNAIFGVGYAHRQMPGDLGNSGWAQPTQTGTLPVQVKSVHFTPIASACATIGCVGDSLDQGWNTTGATELQYKAPVLFASQYARADGKFIGYKVRAIGGRSHILSMSDIPLLDGVDFVTIRTWSPNGTEATQAHWDAKFSETMDAINAILSIGAVPVLLTSPPVGSSGTAETLRVAQNARIKALVGKFIIADIDLAIKDPDDASVLAPSYIDPLGNSTHLSLAGYQKCGEVIYNAIKHYM